MLTLFCVLGVFDNDMQQDAHEFLNHLLNTCGDILLAEKQEEKDRSDKQKAKSNYYLSANGTSASMNFNVKLDETHFLSDETWIHELFQGTLVSTTKCLNCETVRFILIVRIQTNFLLIYSGEQ